MQVTTQTNQEMERRKCKWNYTYSYKMGKRYKS